jgi:hypothetical protein
MELLQDFLLSLLRKHTEGIAEKSGKDKADVWQDDYAAMETSLMIREGRKAVIHENQDKSTFFWNVRRFLSIHVQKDSPYA